MTSEDCKKHETNCNVVFLKRNIIYICSVTSEDSKKHETNCNVVSLKINDAGLSVSEEIAKSMNKIAK